MKKKISNNKVKYFIALHVELLLYSLGSICSKLAGQNEFLSFKFILFYGLVILNLGVYAIVWQQIIKKIPLNTAYSNKAITVVWGILWGYLFFQEQIKWNMIVGALIVIAGVIVVGMADEQ